MQQRNLVLILACDLADKLASAMFVVDREGDLVYFNERAGDILGRSFAEVGRMPADEWAKSFTPMEADGRALNPEELPLMEALRDRRPAHRAFRITAADQEARDIEVTAIPLFAHQREFVGAAAIFWESGEADPGAGEA
jgi:PAS domain-containing protein